MITVLCLIGGGLIIYGLAIFALLFPLTQNRDIDRK